ncbi:MAG TPA: hypothetical protein VHB50_04650 [Bryobacteraceae bacterium]|nr:hypothetical protein [Bryobacteraceae bacterium]
MSFVPLRNPIGFGPVDFIELTIALILLALVLVWRPWIAPLSAKFARRTAWCMAALFLLPLALRLILLPHHPVPAPDIYDEFGHLLEADTLRHGRLANPAHPLHQFFETFFVLQQPTYSSIYPMGNGLAFALGWIVSGLPWAGVLLCMAALCALSYWMLRGWTTPGWALFGGLLAVFEFGPLNQWTNNYWGGGFTAVAGCLVFGALPRLKNRGRIRDAAILGAGLAMHLLSRPYESIFLLLSVALFLIWQARRITFRAPIAASIALPVVFAAGLILLQNKQVTGQWTTLPYQLSQIQYGVPAALTFQNKPVPHAPLTPQQELDYRMQRGFQPGKDTFGAYFARLAFRARYYRFYFYAPLYLALIAFIVTIRKDRWAWVALTCILFALGTNFFPAFQFHYLAGIVCLFILIGVRGLQQLTRLRRGREAARAVVFLCIAQFAFWYALHLPDTADFATETRRFDLWDSINHAGPTRRIGIDRELAGIPGKLLVFVRYWPQHVFQEEWVYNSADIDGQRIVWARDLGDAENQKLIAYYRDRKFLLLEPDARPPRLTPYEPAPAAPEQQEPGKPKNAPPAHPLIELEQVR